jgi:hypothetical protein
MQQDTAQKVPVRLVPDETGKTMIVLDRDYYVSKKVKPSHYVVTSCSSAAGALVGCFIASAIGNLFFVRPQRKRKPGIEPCRMTQIYLTFFGSALGGALGSFIGNYCESKSINEDS